MHEMSLMESVVEIACEEAESNGAAGIRTIRIDVGLLSHVDAAALAFCYDAVKRSTLAEQAELEINRIAGEGWCPDCSRKVALETRFDTCPLCGGDRVSIVAGEELKVRELEVI